MKSLVYLALAALLVSSVASADAQGFAKHHHGNKAAAHAAGKHHKGHWAGHHHHRHA